jgi:hypothetical protein
LASLEEKLPLKPSRQTPFPTVPTLGTLAWHPWSLASLNHAPGAQQISPFATGQCSLAGPLGPRNEETLSRYPRPVQRSVSLRSGGTAAPRFLLRSRRPGAHCRPLDPASLSLCSVACSRQIDWSRLGLGLYSLSVGGCSLANTRSRNTGKHQMRNKLEIQNPKWCGATPYDLPAGESN